MRNYIRTSVVLPIFILAAIFSLSSCKSGDSEQLLSEIPSSASFILKLNPSQILTNAGCTIDSDGNVTLPAEINNLINEEGGMAGQAIAKEVMSIAKCFDLDEAYFFQADDNHPVAIALLADQKEAIASLEKYIGKAVEEQGYSILNPDRNCCIAIRDSKMFVSDRLSDIVAVVNKAHQKSILESAEGIAKWLAADNAMACAIAPEFCTQNYLPVISSKHWICFSTKLDGKTASGEIALLTIDGERYEFGKAFDTIDDSFLNNLPSNSNVAFAVGNIVEPALRKQLNAIASNAGEFGPMISEINGTMALGGVLNFKELNNQLVGNPYNFTNVKTSDVISGRVLIPYFGTTANKAASLMAELFTMDGANVAPQGNNLYSVVSRNGENFDFGVLDRNTFFIGTPISGNAGANSLAEYFKGSRIAGVSIAKPGELSFGIKFGATGTLSVTEDAVKFKTTLTGTDLPFLHSYVALIENPEFINAMTEAMSRSYNFYDYDDYDYTYGGYGGDNYLYDEDTEMYIEEGDSLLVW